MADEGTAVLEPETIEEAPETEAPNEELNTAADSLETDGSEGTPETVEMIPAAEVQARIETALKDAYEAQQEQAREFAQEQAYQERRQRASQARNGKALQALQNVVQWAYKEAEEGRDLRLNPQVLGNLAVELDNMAFVEQHDAIVASQDAFLGQVYPQFKPSQAVARKIAQAAMAHNYPALVAAQHEKVLEAVRAEMWPILRKEVEAEIKQKTGAAGKTQAIRDADATRRAAGSPTASGEPGGSGGDPRAILSDPTSSTAARRSAFERRYGFKPDF